jgi:hypothetical protein
MTSEPHATDTETNVEATNPGARYTWPSIAVAVVFGLLNAYVLWSAVGNLLSLPATLGTVTPWWLLILDVAAPVVTFVIAFILGRRRSLGVRALYFLVALAAVGCSTVGSIAYIQSHFAII